MTIKTEHNEPIHNSRELAIAFRAILQAGDEQDYQKEHFWICAMDTKNRIRFIELITLGTLTSSLVHPREVFRFAIMKNAASITCIHNHPSGDCEPSQDDIEITKRLVVAGRILGVHVLDHLIISDTGHVSLMEKGYML